MVNCKYCKTDKPVDDFYQSSIRKDGKSGNCKECIRARVRANRADKIEYYREFDRQRANLPHRVEARKEYAQTEQGKERLQAGKNAYHKRYPARYVARNAVNNAVRDGRLHKPSQCESCSNETALHGHHCDYNKPMDVMWLCDPCHKQWHRNNTPIYCSELKAS